MKQKLLETFKEEKHISWALKDCMRKHGTPEGENGLNRKVTGLPGMQAVGRGMIRDKR